MIVPQGKLDCAPLGPFVEANLSDADLRRIMPLQRVLLSPLDYPAVDDWRRAVNRTTIAVFDSDAAMFQLDADGLELQYSEEFDAADTSQYAQELMPGFARDLTLYRRATELKAGNRSMLWAQDLEWLYGSEYFNEFLLPTGALDPLWVAAPTHHARYPAMLHTYHDGRRSEHFFGAADVALMRLLQPALEAGVRTILQAAANRESLAAAFDTIDDGALLYDLQGGLVHRSRSVAALAGTRRGEEIIVSAGRELAQAIAAGDSAVRNVSTRGGVYRLTAILLGEGVFTMRPAVLVTLAPRDERLPDRDTIRHRFGLTPRQTDVALLMVKRRTNAEMADELCISEHTVRSHVEAVMGKLGLHDRRELPNKLRIGGGTAEGSER